MKLPSVVAVGLVLASTAALASTPPVAPVTTAPDAPRAPRTAHVTPPKKPHNSGYAANVRDWHTASPDAHPAIDADGHPLLVLRALNTTDRAAFPAASAAGGFSASDLDHAAYVLRDPGSGNRHPVVPRLLDLVFRIQSHFGAEELRVLSGYRTPARSGASNHGKGRALDFIVPGASDAEVAAYARTLGFVGVGIYPVSGFVHVDVRDRSYFWSDASGPGKRNRERGILGDLAKSADRDAAARGEIPLAACALQFDVDAALRFCARTTEADDDDDEPND